MKVIRVKKLLLAENTQQNLANLFLEQEQGLMGFEDYMTNSLRIALEIAVVN